MYGLFILEAVWHNKMYFSQSASLLFLKKFITENDILVVGSSGYKTESKLIFNSLQIKTIVSNLGLLFWFSISWIVRMLILSFSASSACVIFSLFLLFITAKANLFISFLHCISPQIYFNMRLDTYKSHCSSYYMNYSTQRKGILMKKTIQKEIG